MGRGGPHPPALLGYQLYDEPEYKAGGGLGVEAQEELAELVEAFRKQRAAIRQWDPNRTHRCRWSSTWCRLSSWTAYLPVIDSFQIDRYPCGSSQAYFGHQGDWGP